MATRNIRLEKPKEPKRYWVCGWTMDSTELEDEYYDFDDARYTAQGVIEEGGSAGVTDDDGNEYDIWN